MKIETYSFPKSSFLSVDKDMSLITEQMLKNNRLKKLLFYTSKDAMDRPNISQEETLELIGKNIKNVPKLTVDGSVLNYIIISFDNFTPSENPEFRDNMIVFDILCHFDQWNLRDFALRPYKIAAEIDTMFNGKHLTGIGELEFAGGSQLILNDEFGGLTLMYAAVHGEEDKKNALNPIDNTSIINNFNELFND